MRHSRLFPILLLVAVAIIVPSAYAGEGPFVGVDLGVSEPTHDNYRAHVQTGATGSPFVGYMFNKYVGLQGELNITAQPPDNDHRRFLQPNIENENRTTVMIGSTMGPRLSIPLGELADIYLIGQGGAFKGVSGRLNQWAPGFSVGGGLEFNLTPQFAVGLFARWNRAYMAPHPTFLVNHVANDQGPKDARWATGGISLKYSFERPAPAPAPRVAQAPPPAPPPPAPPVKKKIVLRGVHFDFDKSAIRRDAAPVLDEAVRTLKEEGTIAVISEGHTDSRGTDAYNLKLSHRRAEAVRKYLVDHGIAANRIRTEGFGESRPVASNDTDDGRAQNRRVELRVE